MIKQTTLLLSILLGSCLVSRADELADLQAQRVETLQQAVGLIEMQYRQGAADVQQLLDAKVELLDAKLDAASTPEQRIEALTQQLKLSRTAEKLVDSLVHAGRAKQSDFLLAKAARLRVETLLLKERKRGVDDSSSLKRDDAAASDLNEVNATAPSSKNLLAGKWAGTVDEDNRLLVTFNSNGAFELVNVDPAMTQRVKVRATGTYKTDLSVRPAHLDLDATVHKQKREEPAEHKFKTIIQIVDTNTFRMSDLESNSRPKTFGKRSVVMRRQIATNEKPE